MNAQTTQGALVRSFFENLLPEGDALEDILAALHLRGASTLDILGRLGKELPGVLSLLPEAERAMLERMSLIFEQHAGNALSMTAPPAAA